MQRTVLIALATALVAAAISAGATILLTDEDDIAFVTPLPTTSPLELATEEPEPSPEATATDDDGVQPAPAPDDQTASPDDGDGSDGDSDDGTVRSASSVNCDKEPKRCSAEHAVRVRDGNVDGELGRDDPPSYSGVPTITMTSELRQDDDSEADDGDELGAIFVEVTVENTTDETFVFNKREVALDIYRDGERVQTLATEGPGFNLTPGGKMSATFDRPIASDGRYEWRAKIWYYRK
jgi:hypothetical protein